LTEQAGIIYGGEKWMKDNNVAKDHLDPLRPTMLANSLVLTSRLALVIT